MERSLSSPWRWASIAGHRHVVGSSRAPTMRRRANLETDRTVWAPNTRGHVGWLELFYDLVFVAAVITFSDAISLEPNLGRIGAVDCRVRRRCGWSGWRPRSTPTATATTARCSARSCSCRCCCSPSTRSPSATASRRTRSSISITYALLALDVAVMYARARTGATTTVALAALRRNQYCGRRPTDLREPRSRPKGARRALAGRHRAARVADARLPLRSTRRGPAVRRAPLRRTPRVC